VVIFDLWDDPVNGILIAAIFVIIMIIMIIMLIVVTMMNDDH